MDAPALKTNYLFFLVWGKLRHFKRVEHDFLLCYIADNKINKFPRNPFVVVE